MQKMIDFIIENATEIMQLCFGVGFLLVALFLTRFLIIVSRTAKNVNEATDIFVEYVKTPLEVLALVREKAELLGRYLRRRGEDEDEE